MVPFSMTFWHKQKVPGKEIPIHYCEKHRFTTSNPLEIEEHEKIHMIEEGGVKPE